MEDQNYLKTKVHPILEAMMVQLLVHKPDKIVDAMIEWLEDKEQNEDDQDQEQSQEDIQKDIQENRNYINTRIHIIFEKIIMDLLVEKPQDPIKYMINWLKEKGKMYVGQSTQSFQGDNLKTVKKPKDEEMPSSEEEEEDEEEDYAEEIPLAVLQKKGLQGMRTSVSAEAYGKFNVKDEHFKPRVIPKTQEQKERILKRLSQAFMFSTLGDRERDIVLEAMEEKRFKPGDWVIKQGESGDELYVVDLGELDCFKKISNSEEPKFLKTYHPGESFGELTLLYSSPRQASIRAKTDSILWALDRDTFNNIVKEAAQRKREDYEKFLTQVDLLSDMNEYERMQICDSLKQLKFKKGEYVVKQGDQGDMFFMIENGELVALKVSQPGGQPEEVMVYKPGMYFGELSLMGDQPRQASILCKTDCTLAALDRYSFKRLLGPIDEILQRNAQKYANYQNKK